MIRRLMLLPAALLLLLALFALPALAADEGTTVRIQGFGGEDADEFRTIRLPGAVQIHDFLEEYAERDLGLNWGALENVQIDDEGTAYQIERSSAVGPDAPQSDVAPDFLVAPRADSYPVFDSAPAPRLIGILKNRVVESARDWPWSGWEMTANNVVPACEAPPAEYVVFAYMDDARLENDPSVPRLLSAIQTLVEQSNLIVSEMAEPRITYFWPYPPSGYDVWPNKPEIIPFEDYHPSSWRHLYPDLIDKGSSGTWQEDLKPIDPHWDFIIEKFNDESIDWPWIASRPCSVKWDFYALTGQGWELAKSDTLTVELEWSTHPALHELYRDALLEGTFAALGIAVNLQYGAPSSWFGGGYERPVERLFPELKDKLLRPLKDERFKIMAPSHGGNASDDAAPPDIVIKSVSWFEYRDKSFSRDGVTYEQIGTLSYDGWLLWNPWSGGKWGWLHSGWDSWRRAQGFLPSREFVLYATEDTEEDARVRRFLDAMRSAVGAGLGILGARYIGAVPDGSWTLEVGDERTTSPGLVSDVDC